MIVDAVNSNHTGRMIIKKNRHYHIPVSVTWTLSSVTAGAKPEPGNARHRRCANDNHYCNHVTMSKLNQYTLSIISADDTLSFAQQLLLTGADSFLHCHSTTVSLNFKCLHSYYETFRCKNVPFLLWWYNLYAYNFSFFANNVSL